MVLVGRSEDNFQESWFYLSIVWVLGIKLRTSDWQLVPFLVEPSHPPIFVFLRKFLTFTNSCSHIIQMITFLGPE